MADIFSGSEAKSLFSTRRILFFGGSNVRAFYKDILWLMNNNTLIEGRCLKAKQEKSFQGDRLVHCSALNRGRNYQEEREFKDYNTFVKFTFITKCLNDDMKNMMLRVKRNEDPAPDVIVMNSCLWDISRWGPNGASIYRENMQKLMQLWKECLPQSTLIVWTTALPLALGMRGGGFLVGQVDFLTTILPYEVMEANLFARQVVVANGFDVLDFNFHLRLQIHRRARDGIHWEPIAVRHLINLLLTHVSLSWGKKLPGRARPHALARMMNVDSGVRPAHDKSQSQAEAEPPVPEKKSRESKCVEVSKKESQWAGPSNHARRRQKQQLPGVVCPWQVGGARDRNTKGNDNFNASANYGTFRSDYAPQQYAPQQPQVLPQQYYQHLQQHYPSRHHQHRNYPRSPQPQVLPQQYYQHLQQHCPSRHHQHRNYPRSPQQQVLPQQFYQHLQQHYPTRHHQHRNYPRSPQPQVLPQQYYQHLQQHYPPRHHQHRNYPRSPRHDNRNRYQPYNMHR